MIFIKQYLITLTFIVIAVWVMPANTQRGTLSVLCTVLYEFGHLKKQYEGIYKDAQVGKFTRVFSGIADNNAIMQKLKKEKPAVQREAERKKLEELKIEKLIKEKDAKIQTLSVVFSGIADNNKALKELKEEIRKEEEKAKQWEEKRKKLEEEDGKKLEEEARQQTIKEKGQLFIAMSDLNKLKKDVRNLQEKDELKKEKDEEEKKAKLKDEKTQDLRRQQSIKEDEGKDAVKKRQLKRVISGMGENNEKMQELKKKEKEVKQKVNDLKGLRKEQSEKTLEEIKNILTEIAENEHIANNAEIINFNAKISTTKDVDKVLRNLTLNFASYIKEIEREMVCPSVQDFCCARTESTNHIDFYKSIFDISVNT